MAPKSFSLIPGPKSWPLLGTLPYYYFGPCKKYDLKSLHKNGMSKYQEFGPIVREEILPNLNILWLFDPEDIKAMLKYDGTCPARRSHLALEKYRKDRPHRYNCGGLLPTNGSEWLRIRRAVQKPLNVPKRVESFHGAFHDIASEFVETTDKNSSDFLENLKRYFLEVTGSFSLDIRLGATTNAELDKDSTASRLIDAAFSTNSNILATDNGLGIWKFMETKEYAAIRTSQTYIEEVALNVLRKKFSLIKGSSALPSTLLEEYVLTYKLDEKDILTMICDTLLAGIDTSAYTTAFIFYHLARNPQAQSRLRDHIFSNLSSDTDLKSFSYGKAVLKETLRLNPVSVGIGRILQVSDAVFSGFAVPKGTVLVSQNQITCRLEKYFDRPLEFLPERWIHSSEEPYHPFALLPFGFGPRMCVGRRIAEASIYILMINFFKNYKVQLKDPGMELDTVSDLINRPDKPIQLKFEKL